MFVLLWTKSHSVQGSNIISSNPGYDEDRWEMCIVLPVEASSKGYTERGKKFMKKLVESGAEIYSYLDHSNTYIFVVFRYTEGKLAAFADLIDYELMLDPIELQKICEKGCPEQNIAPVTIFDDRSVCKYSPYEYIHARYVSRLDHS
jgi:hypothetical protein